jgi:hypothetical protein
MSLDTDTLFSRRLPVATALPAPLKGVGPDSARKALLRSSGETVATIDELTEPVILRDPKLAANVLGLAGVAHIRALYHTAREIELDRGAEGFSPEAIDSVYPAGVLCVTALERVVDGYMAWNDNPLIDTELSDW